MRKIILFLAFLFLTQYNFSAQSIIELRPSDNMSISGKGKGQDAVINPFLKQNSLVIIENIGKNDFVIRIKENGKILKLITIKPTEIKRIDFLKTYEMYFDATLAAKAKVDFKKLE